MFQNNVFWLLNNSLPLLVNVCVWESERKMGYHHIDFNIQIKLHVLYAHLTIVLENGRGAKGIFDYFFCLRSWTGCSVRINPYIINYVCNKIYKLNIYLVSIWCWTEQILCIAWSYEQVPLFLNSLRQHFRIIPRVELITLYYNLSGNNLIKSTSHKPIKNNTY